MSARMTSGKRRRCVAGYFKPQRIEHFFFTHAYRLGTNDYFMKKFIRVDAVTMTDNLRNGTHNPPVIVRENGGRVWRCQNARILGPSSVRYRPEKPLSCGAKCWIETESEIVMEGEEVVST